MVITAIVCKGWDLTEVYWARIRCWTVLNTVMNLWINGGKFLDRFSDCQLHNIDSVTSSY